MATETLFNVALLRNGGIAVPSGYSAVDTGQTWGAYSFVDSCRPWANQDVRGAGSAGQTTASSATYACSTAARARAV